MSTFLYFIHIIFDIKKSFWLLFVLVFTVQCFYSPMWTAWQISFEMLENSEQNKTKPNKKQKTEPNIAYIPLKMGLLTRQRQQTFAFVKL